MTTPAASFVESLLAGRAPDGSAPGPRLQALRREALERAHQLTVPTTREEAWRFTDLTPLYKLAFKPAASGPALPAPALEGFAWPGINHRLVFVDGRYAPVLSNPTSNVELTLTPLASADDAIVPALDQRLGALAPFADNAFRAINTAHLADAGVVHVGRGTAAGPVHLLFVSTQAEVATHPRVLIVAEAGADVLVLEEHCALHAGAYLVNAVTEVDVAVNSRVRHVRLQRESGNAFHIATSAARIGRDGRYESNSIALGARISRLELQARFDGEGGYASLDGLALIGGRQLADTHSFIDHATPHCQSRQLHKTVVAGGAHAVFNGRILVRPGAQLTDSAQESRNLLLSGKAHVDTKPQLEIFADDVKCAHGATVGQHDAEALFYLQTRGLAAHAARNLLTYAFAAEIVDRIPVPPVVKALREHVLSQTQAKD